MNENGKGRGFKCANAPSQNSGKNIKKLKKYFEKLEHIDKMEISEAAKFKALRRLKAKFNFEHKFINRG